MKKIISILIALTMLVSMIPTVFAEGEAAVPVAKTYSFNNQAAGVTRNSYLSEITEMTPDGWMYFPTTGDATANQANDYAVVGNSNDALLFNVQKGEFKIALELRAPEIPAFYIPSTVVYANEGTSNSRSVKMYMSKPIVSENFDYYAESNMVCSGTSGSYENATLTADTAIYAGSNELIVSAFWSSNTRQRYKTITLNPILNPVMKTVIKNVDNTTSTELSFDLGSSDSQTVTLATMVSGTDVTDMPVSDSFIIYKSSDEDVATVSADGTITAIEEGTATIYAESSDGEYSSLNDGITVTVTAPQPEAKTYIFNYVDTELGTGTLLSEITEGKNDTKGNNFYDTHGWRYFPTEGDATAKESKSNPYYAVVSNVGNSLIFNENYGAFKFALELQAPEIAAFYIPSVLVYCAQGGAGKPAGMVKMYMSKPAVDNNNYDYYAELNLLLNKPSVSYEDATLSSDVAIYAAPNEAFVSAFWSENYKQRFKKVTLDPILNPQLTITADKTELSTNEIANIASTKVSGTYVEPMNVGNGFIEYKSSDVNVATVATDGIITAVGRGTAEIWAETPDSKVKSNEVTITVTAPAAPEDDEELSNAFEVTEAPAIGYVESTVTGITEDETIEAEKNSNGTFTLTAPETKDDAKFLYWAKGMSANKKIVSFSNKLENYMPEENGKNYLIAVYEGDVSETAEYYNANGQRIATGTEPALPSMAGYGKATGWKKYGATNIYVAEYAGKTQPDNVTVTVDGNERTVPYGTKITCTADSTKENFKCWTKSDINGKTEIVSASEVYSFNAWENCTVTAVYEEHTYTGSKLKIILDTFTAGNVTAVMAEFIGLSDAVEKGIMYNGTKIAMTTPGNQFTVTAEDGGTFTGYAVVKNATDGYTLITDGSVTVSK